MSCLKYILESMEFMDNAELSPEQIEKKLGELGVEYVVEHLEGEKGETTLLKACIPGTEIAEENVKTRTLGIIGTLAGVGVRPKRPGLVSDADGAIIALACIMKLKEMQRRGDSLPSDVILATHIAPSTSVRPRDPVNFVEFPADLYKILDFCVDDRMDAILSVDSTKGNRITNWSNVVITPPVKEGWILKIPDEVLDIYERVCGRSPCIVPVTTQDLTPYGNNIHHLNIIVQPWLQTDAPVLGVGTTAQIPVAGTVTGANYPFELTQATRFCIEIAKYYTTNECDLYDQEEFQRLKHIYGDIGEHLKRDLQEVN